MTTTAKGRILISKDDRLGYTAATQVYIIQNGGGAAAYNFLKANERHFTPMRLDEVRMAHTLTADRIEMFKDYAASNGLEVVLA
jgi:hypothetical protein